MKWSSLQPSLIIASLTALALTGCSSDGDDDRPSDPTPQSEAVATVPVAGLDGDGDGFYNYDEFVRGVTWAVGQFEWPPGVTITSDLILAGPQGSHDPRRDRFQLGLETGVVQMWHHCAWLGTWLDAFRIGDSVLQAESLAIAGAGFDIGPAMDPGSQEFIDGMVQKADLGDPSVVQQFISANCVFLNGYPWWSSPVASPSAPPAIASPVATPIGIAP